MGVSAGELRPRCVSAVMSTKHARRGQRCRADGHVAVDDGDFVCWSHHTFGWIHFERGAVDPAVALRMRAVLEMESAK